MSSTRPGDTLIEVLFAFAILATIAAFTFTAAIQGYKNAVQAQNQTQANFLAQYQADALKTYRDSLEWNNTATQSFLGGFNSPGLPQLPAMSGFINPVRPFCMRGTLPGGAGPIRWEVVDNTSTCNSNIASQAPNLPNPTVRIEFSDPVRFDEFTGTFVEDNSDPDKLTATVTVTYDIPNANVDGEVINTITLTRER